MKITLDLSPEVINLLTADAADDEAVNEKIKKLLVSSKWQPVLEQVVDATLVDVINHLTVVPNRSNSIDGFVISKALKWHLENTGKKDYCVEFFEEACELLRKRLYGLGMVETVEKADHHFNDSYKIVSPMIRRHGVMMNADAITDWSFYPNWK